MNQKRIGVGLIASGFMGKTHAIGFMSAARVFDLLVNVDFPRRPRRGRHGRRPRPRTWRIGPAGEGRTLADIGSHILATAQHLVGPVLGPDFPSGCEIQRLVQLAYGSSLERRWLDVGA